MKSSMTAQLAPRQPAHADAEWERVALSLLYRVKYGKTNPSRPGNVPVVGSSGVYAWTDTPLVEHPTVVVGRKGSAGHVWLLEVPSYPSDTTFYLEPRELGGVDVRFTYFALRHLQISASDDVIPSLQRHELENVHLPAPPISEQHAIAAALSKIQAAVEVQDRTVATLKELKAATMAKLFHEGLRREPLRQTEIGEIPASWEVVELGQVARIERGKFAHRPRNDPRFYGGNIPFIQTGDVAKSNGRIRTYSQTLNEQGLAVSRMFPKGTVVLTIAANIADTGILEFDSAFPDSLVGVTPDETMDPTFLEYYLRTQKSEMDRLAPKGTQKNINIQFLKPWPVPRPFSDEQREIAHSLRCIDDMLDGASARRYALRKLFSSMLHLLMTGQLRLQVEASPTGEVATGWGQVDRRDPVVPETLPPGLDRFVAELVRRFEPERAILFGRHAEGSPKSGSEVGLLVVREFEGRALAEAVRIEREIAHDFSLHVVARRPEEVECALEIGDRFIVGIAERGKVLYARPDAGTRVRPPARPRAGERRATPGRALDEAALREIVRSIVDVAAPEKIILFGSAARGEMGPDSDVDLMVVKSCADPREVARAIRRRLIGVAPGLPKDVIVVTPEDVERHKDTIGLIIRPALREGRVVHAA